MDTQKRSRRYALMAALVSLALLGALTQEGQAQNWQNMSYGSGGQARPYGGVSVDSNRAVYRYLIPDTSACVFFEPAQTEGYRIATIQVLSITSAIVVSGAMVGGCSVEVLASSWPVSATQNAYDVLTPVDEIDPIAGNITTGASAVVNPPIVYYGMYKLDLEGIARVQLACGSTTVGGTQQLILTLEK